MIENSIVTTKISKTFNEKKVLNDISINIEKGQIFGLLGPSGAGKTTFIKIITGQIKANSGTAEVLGTDVTKFDKKMYSNFGMMLDNTGVYMTPLVCISSIIAEEKESNTLRVLLMSNVKASEYLIGISTYVEFLCTIGSIVIGLQGDFSQEEFLRFVLLMAIGILVSSLVGATLGIFSKNQMGATSISVPLMVIFSFVPMLSIFNESIKKYASVIYTQQLSNAMNDIHADSIDTKALIITILI